MRIKYKTLQNSMFINFSIFIVLLLTTVAVSLYYYLANDAYKKSSAQQSQLCISVMRSIDDSIERMNTISMNILYSSLIKTHFQSYLTNPEGVNKTWSDSYERYSDITALINIIMAINGPSLPVSQTNIYDLEGHMVGTGRFNGEYNIDISKSEWYTKTLALNGDKFLSVPIENDWLNSMNVLYRGDKYVSLLRTYSNFDDDAKGVIEVMQDCDSLFKYSSETESENLKFFVVNQDGQLVYPYIVNEGRDWLHYYNTINERGLEPLNSHKIDNEERTNTYVLTYAISDYTGWTVMALQPERAIFESLDNIALLFIVFSLIAIVITLIISYLISKNVTLPIKQLSKDVNRIELSTLPNNVVDNGDRKQSIEEIKRLRQAFIDMNRKLNKTLEEVLESKNEEMNAKMLALQSQMNPHFLYNNLATISVMAEEEMNSQIVSLCDNVSYMLRYISVDDRQGVKLREEMEYTNKYVECMKLRYDVNIDVTISLDHSMFDIFVPKLIIQPLVENSIKYCMKLSPPWQIEVNGFICNGKWIISVSDNGIGFNESALKEFQEFRDSYDNYSTIPKLQIGGMSLKNIYSRLRLLYKEDAIFELNIKEDGGSEVRIGGNYLVSKEE